MQLLKITNKKPSWERRLTIPYKSQISEELLNTKTADNSGNEEEVKQNEATKNLFLRRMSVKSQKHMVSDSPRSSVT